VIVIQTDFGQALADGFGLAFHLHGGFRQLRVCWSLIARSLRICSMAWNRLSSCCDWFQHAGRFRRPGLPHPRPAWRCLRCSPVLDLLDAGVQITGQLADLHHLRVRC
jgi:hypothetical protein